MRRAIAVCVVLAAVLCSGATAGQGMLVGVSEDGMKWSPERGALTGRYMYRLGIGAVRVTIRWSPGESVPKGPTLIALRRAIRAAGHRRLVLAVYSRARRAPVIARHRRQYCGFVGRLLRRAGRVRDVVIWNEPNSSAFWRPQFTPDGEDAAAQAYEALLAECWDELHALRPDVNVIAASGPRGNDDPAAARPSHSPLRWYQDLGAAYRASGRERPLFDTVGHNPYPNNTAEPPWTIHVGGTIGEGDYEKLVKVLTDSFFATAQPVPGGGLSIWYMEDGFQTRVDPRFAASYVGQENDPFALAPLATRARRVGGSAPAVDQASQLSDAVRLASCQPYVGAFFNFLLADERALTGWQSGLLWANWRPKPSYYRFRDAVFDVVDGRVDCTRYPNAGAVR
jgi:hypothetical protein